jgi:hypothetical protein
MKAKDIIYIIIIIVITTFFMNDCSRDELIEGETVHVSDTIWDITERDSVHWNITEKDTTIYNHNYISVDVPLSNDKDSLRTYPGVYKHEYGTVIYRAKVSGYLEEISFQSRFEVPERIVYRTEIGTVTETRTITKTPKWNLYGGASAIISGNYFDIGGGIDLRIGRIAYSYDYGVINKTHSIGIKTKIF